MANGCWSNANAMANKLVIVTRFSENVAVLKHFLMNNHGINCLTIGFPTGGSGTMRASEANGISTTCHFFESSPNQNVLIVDSAFMKYTMPVLEKSKSVRYVVFLEPTPDRAAMYENRACFFNAGLFSNPKEGTDSAPAEQRTLNIFTLYTDHEKSVDSALYRHGEQLDAASMELAGGEAHTDDFAVRHAYKVRSDGSREIDSQQILCNLFEDMRPRIVKMMEKTVKKPPGPLANAAAGANAACGKKIVAASATPPPSQDALERESTAMDGFRRLLSSVAA